MTGRPETETPSPGRVGLVLQPANERHDPGGHPENPGRFPPVTELLLNGPDRERLVVVDASPAGVDDLLRAHTTGHVERVREAAATGPTWIDGDTVALPDSFDVALDAAGGAMRAVDLVFDRELPASFALVRPPGHHATASQAMGFCLFNNVAVAARYARQQLGIDRVAILDWDVHHGNGTQDIFEDDPSVLFVSLHQWPLYPGTGWLDEAGTGDGRGYTVNLPMPPGCGDFEFREALTAIAGPVIESFRPGLILVSAGQDAHIDDPLSSQRLTAAGYHRLARQVAALGQRCSAPVVAVQEGGYNPATLPQLNREIIAGLGGFPDGNAGPEEAGTDTGTASPAWPDRLAEIRRVRQPFRAGS